MKKVKMRTHYAGPNGTCNADGHIDLQENEAAELVKGGYAEYVAAPAAAKPEAKKAAPAAGEAGAEGQAETAEAEPAEETAEITPIKNKRRGAA